MRAQATEGQLPLLMPDLRPLVRVPVKQLSLDEQFAAFHAANPQVYEVLRLLALQMVQAGKRKFGVRLLWERLRWEYAIQTTCPLTVINDDGEEVCAGGVGMEYALNNNLTSRYAELLAQQEPTLAAAIEQRAKRSRTSRPRGH